LRVSRMKKGTSGGEDMSRWKPMTNNSAVNSLARWYRILPATAVSIFKPGR
jgi:hypothetical protein